MDNFKGLHTCLIPPNTTDLLQPMDLSVNKPAKSFSSFQSGIQQLQAQNDVPLQEVVLAPIDLSLPYLKNVSAGWFAEMAEYISSNP